MKKKNPPSNRTARRSNSNQSLKAKGVARPAAIPRSRWARLAQAIANAPARVTRLSHADCEAALEFYIDCELRQQDARKLYPSVWKHLQTCARCRESYDLAKSTLELDQPEQPPQKTLPALPFLAPAAENAAWSKRVRARVGGATLGFGFLIQPSHLRHLFTSTSLALARGHTTAENRSLLLTDTVNLGQREVMVEMWIQRSADSAEGHLEISVASSAPLPEPLRAKLQWNDHTLSAIVQQGSCSFEHLAIAELQSARDLRIEFEAGASNAEVEGKDGDHSA